MLVFVQEVTTIGTASSVCGRMIIVVLQDTYVRVTQNDPRFPATNIYLVTAKLEISSNEKEFSHRSGSPRSRIVVKTSMGRRRVLHT